MNELQVLATELDTVCANIDAYEKDLADLAQFVTDEPQTIYIKPEPIKFDVPNFFRTLPKTTRQTVRRQLFRLPRPSEKPVAVAV